MARTYDLRLKVCSTTGKVVIAKITQISLTTSRISLPYIKEVEEDKQIGFPNGIYVKVYDRGKHTEVVNSLTKYLETLFLKELANEDNNSSKHSGDKSGGNESQTDTESAELHTGEKSGSVHNSGGGRKSSSSRGRGKPETDMAKSRN